MMQVSVPHNKKPVPSASYAPLMKHCSKPPPPGLWDHLHFFIFLEQPGLVLRSGPQLCAPAQKMRAEKWFLKSFCFLPGKIGDLGLSFVFRLQGLRRLPTVRIWNVP